MLAARTVDFISRSNTDPDITHVTCVNGRYRVVQTPAMRPSALSSRGAAAQLPARAKRGPESSTRGGARAGSMLTRAGDRGRVGDLDRPRYWRERALLGGTPRLHLAQESAAAFGRQRPCPLLRSRLSEPG